MPRVLNRRTDTIPEDAIYVGRPSKWGNPYHVGARAPGGKRWTREQVIAAYERLLRDTGLIKDIGELRGHDLVCWCAPLACHADVLLEVANE